VASVTEASAFDDPRLRATSAALTAHRQSVRYVVLSSLVVGIGLAPSALTAHRQSVHRLARSRWPRHRTVEPRSRVPVADASDWLVTVVRAVESRSGIGRLVIGLPSSGGFSCVALATWAPHLLTRGSVATG